MRVKMLKDCGGFKTGGVYDVSREIAKLFFTRGQAVIVLDDQPLTPANKAMASSQVRKAGVD